jgi:hypothetical protein
MRLYKEEPMMKASPPIASSRSLRLSVLAAAAALAACGGSSSDDYLAYLADGHTYRFSVDTGRKEARFHDVPLGPGDGELAITGSAPALSFGRQPGAGATARLVVTKDDLVVGNAPLQGRATPFVAARKFLASAADAAGDYNVFAVRSPAPGDYVSAPATWRIESTGGLQVCAMQVPTRISSCPAESLVRYTLSMDGDQFVASAPAASPLRFRVARVGADRILLQAEASGTTGRFAIGLPDSASAFPATRVQAPSTDGAWSVVDHNGLNYSSEGVTAGGSAANFNGALGAGGASVPPGVRLFDGGGAYVMQSGRLTVLLGRPATPADGYLQIGVRPD